MISHTNSKVICDFANKTQKDFSAFLKQYSSYRIYDLYETLFKDAQAVVDPALYFLPPQKKLDRLEKIYKEHLSNQGKETFQLGKWVVLPLSSEIYHLIEQPSLLNLRTVRNRNLITASEQLNLYAQKVLLVGLSVGSNVLTNLVRIGVGDTYTLIDYDKVDSHNVNRTQYALRNIGQEKVVASAQAILSIDPYLDVTLIDGTVSDADSDQLVSSHNIIIDAFDHFEGKIDLRNKAKKHKKPVISGWDVGSGMVIIVERYDLDDELTIDLFLNNISLEEVLRETSSLREKIDIFIKIIGKETHDERMLSSVYSIGSELTGIPQHVIATSLTAAVFTQVVVDTILNKPVSSLRKHLDLNALIYSRS